MPCATPPSIWPAARMGWRTLPTSWRAWKSVTGGGVGGGVDGDFGYVDGPGVGGVGVAAVGVVVPEDVAGGLRSGRRLEVAVLWRGSGGRLG